MFAEILIITVGTTLRPAQEKDIIDIYQNIGTLIKNQEQSLVTHHAVNFKRLRIESADILKGAIPLVKEISWDQPENSYTTDIYKKMLVVKVGNDDNVATEKEIASVATQLNNLLAILPIDRIYPLNIVSDFHIVFERVHIPIGPDGKTRVIVLD